jgi:hypothetical protein
MNQTNPKTVRIVVSLPFFVVVVILVGRVFASFSHLYEIIC